MSDLTSDSKPLLDKNPSNTSSNTNNTKSNNTDKKIDIPIIPKNDLKNEPQSEITKDEPSNSTTTTTTPNVCVSFLYHNYYYYKLTYIWK